MQNQSRNIFPTIFGTAKVLVSSLIPKISRRESENISRLLVEHVTDLPYHRILMDPDLRFTAPQWESWQALAARLEGGEPLQYVLGQAWFRGLCLQVDPSVLIPRPETEELVEHILQTYAGQAGIRLLDLGTGSGCIALSLAQEMDQAEVHAMDLSPAALATARRNAEAHGLALRFHLSDMCDLQPGDWSPLDLVVSNPPYIPASEAAEMEAHVLDHEPHLALFTPDDAPLTYYICAMDFSRQVLKPGGWLYFEIHEEYGPAIAEGLESRGFLQVELIHDLQGKCRMARGLHA